MLEEAHGEASLAAEAALAGPGAAPELGSRELEAELAYLRTFSDVYRAHLQAYLDKLLRNVEEWDRAEKETLAAVHADMSAPPEVPAVPPLPPLPRVPPSAAGRPAVVNELAEDWPLADGPVRPDPAAADTAGPGRERVAAGQELPGVVEQDDPVAQQAPALLGVSGHGAGGVTPGGGRRGARGEVMARPGRGASGTDCPVPGRPARL